MNTSELLHTIARDRIAGMQTIDSYQLKPTILNITAKSMLCSLENDMWILNTRILPEFISELELISSDNVFKASPIEYELMDEYRYQVFTDHLNVETITEDFKPFRLEFVKIIPHRNAVKTN